MLVLGQRTWLLRFCGHSIPLYGGGRNPSKKNQNSIFKKSRVLFYYGINLNQDLKVRVASLRKENKNTKNSFDDDSTNKLLTLET